MRRTRDSHHVRALCVSIDETFVAVYEGNAVTVILTCASLHAITVRDKLLSGLFHALPFLMKISIIYLSHHFFASELNVIINKVQYFIRAEYCKVSKKNFSKHNLTFSARCGRDFRWWWVIIFLHCYIDELYNSSIVVQNYHKRLIWQRFKIFVYVRLRKNNIALLHLMF